MVVARITPATEIESGASTTTGSKSSCDDAPEAVTALTRRTGLGSVA
jgi:hypothetical protein